ncbi:uncharacterized protein DUF4262 [Geodermatophilus tzadiensis]|uniref:Uncharacterized protein DUF4262 n=1 Tax=Geodermatophilus tzadiensis TaxID=1137988 RepID=A0A2T0U084_9ACTN|nr:DUF4262 domain-containing protein [Geodermatophilus tzadiensis]PRY51228.1 uncharacterized protein DUF4262 [Geodermatophilus tzadiensis]
MSTDPQTTAWLDQEDAHLAAVIRRARFAVQYVGPGEGPGEPAFGYTIGLFGLGHPELVVVARSAPATHALLDAVAGQVVAGRSLVPGELVEAAGEALVVEECPNPGEVLLGANRWYQRPAEYSVPAQQLAWASPAGCWPWDAGWDGGAHGQPRPGTWTA